MPTKKTYQLNIICSKFNFLHICTLEHVTMFSLEHNYGFSIFSLQHSISKSKFQHCVALLLLQWWLNIQHHSSTQITFKTCTVIRCIKNLHFLRTFFLVLGQLTRTVARTTRLTRCCIHVFLFFFFFCSLNLLISKSFYSLYWISFTVQYLRHSVFLCHSVEWGPTNEENGNTRRIENKIKMNRNFYNIYE